MKKTANKNVASGYCSLDSNSLVPVANIPTLSESKITNLTTDLSNCEKTANKNVASGYCPLDSNSLVPVANIPALSESQITNLTTDLSNCEKTANKGIYLGYAPLNAYVQLNDQYVDNTYFLNTNQYDIATQTYNVPWNSYSQVNPRVPFMFGNNIQFTYATRYNIHIVTPQKITNINYTVTCTNNNSIGFDFYGTNDSSQFNNSLNVLTGLTKLNAIQYNFANGQLGNIPLITPVSFRYYVIIETILSTPYDINLSCYFQYQSTGIPTLDSTGLLKSTKIPQTYVKQINT